MVMGMIINIILFTETKVADPGIVVFLNNTLKGTVRPGIINEIASRLMHKQKYNEIREQLDYVKVFFHSPGKRPHTTDKKRK